MFGITAIPIPNLPMRFIVLYLTLVVCCIQAIGAPAIPAQEPPFTISVFPNPSPEGIFTLQLRQPIPDQPIQLRVYNLLGEEIWYREIAEGVLFIELTIELSNYPRGAYMLEVSQGGIKQSSRLSYY